MTRPFDFSELSALWVAHIEGAVAAVRDRLPREEVFYAIAFWNLYAAQGDRILRASASLAGERWLQSCTKPGAAPRFGSIKWNPAEWPWSLDDGDDEGSASRLDAAHASLSAFATRDCGSTGAPSIQRLTTRCVQTWDDAFERSVEALADAARTLTARARAGSGPFAGLRLSADFAVLVCDVTNDDDGVRWLLRYHDPKLVATLFPHGL